MASGAREDPDGAVAAAVAADSDEMGVVVKSFVVVVT